MHVPKADFPHIASNDISFFFAFTNLNARLALRNGKWWFQQWLHDSASVMIDWSGLFRSFRLMQLLSTCLFYYRFFAEAMYTCVYSCSWLKMLHNGISHKRDCFTSQMLVGLNAGLQMQMRLKIGTVQEALLCLLRETTAEFVAQDRLRIGLQSWGRELQGFIIFRHDVPFQWVFGYFMSSIKWTEQERNFYLLASAEEELEIRLDVPSWSEDSIFDLLRLNFRTFFEILQICTYGLRHIFFLYVEKTLF